MFTPTLLLSTRSYGRYGLTLRCYTTIIKPFYPIWDCSVCSSKRVELCMDGFSPLHPKETESNIRIVAPGNAVRK
ncbi:hypothetical protein EMCRGX_G013266 [Ephydatia muelleri]